MSIEKVIAVLESGDCDERLADALRRAVEAKKGNNNASLSAERCCGSGSWLEALHQLRKEGARRHHQDDSVPGVRVEA